MDADQLGRIVREAWIAWSKEQPEPKESWLVPYDELDEADKEADRRIGRAVAAAVREEDCKAVCKWCRDGYLEPVLLDEDGVLIELTGNPGKWSHAYEDTWWDCDAAAIRDLDAQEVSHAEPSRD